MHVCMYAYIYIYIYIYIHTTQYHALSLFIGPLPSEKQVAVFRQDRSLLSKQLPHSTPPGPRRAFLSPSPCRPFMLGSLS